MSSIIPTNKAKVNKKKEKIPKKDISKTEIELLLEDKFIGKFLSTCHKKNKVPFLGSHHNEVNYHFSCGLRTWTDENGNIRPFFCNSWRCNHCRQRKAQELYMRLIKVLSASKYWTFVTLTFDPKTITREEAEDIEGNSWKKMKKTLERKIGKFEYFWVREWTKNGYIHKHLLIRSKALFDICNGVYSHHDACTKYSKGINCYSKFKDWVLPKLVKYGYGKISSWERIRNRESASKYFTKEVTKGNQQIGNYKRNMRIFGSSHGFFKDKVKKEKKIGRGRMLWNAKYEEITNFLQKSAIIKKHVKTRKYFVVEDKKGNLDFRTKPKILEVGCKMELNEYHREIFDEKAGIFEYMDGLSRKMSEHWAAKHLIKEMKTNIESDAKLVNPDAKI